MATSTIYRGMTAGSSDAELEQLFRTIADTIRALAPHYPNRRDYERSAEWDDALLQHEAAIDYLTARAAEFEAVYKLRRAQAQARR